MRYGMIYLVVKDFQRSLDFYKKVLDMQVSETNGERFAVFNNDGLNICLLNGYYDAKHPEQIEKKGESFPIYDDTVDLGCGPGNSTKVLKDKFPNAKIIGADNSDEMLEKARGLYPDIEFINLDANGDLYKINEKFDIVFSNACIQWLPNHKELLPKMMTLLKPNGILAIQIPMQREHPVHIIINELENTAKWSDKITPRQYNNLTTEE